MSFICTWSSESPNACWPASAPRASSTTIFPGPCLAHVGDSVRRVVLLGRLSLYGERAERLHEEIVTVTARWVEPHLRTEPLLRYAIDAERKTLALLDEGSRTRGGFPAE